MSCRKSVTGSLRGLLRRCISSTRTRRASQSSLHCRRQQPFHSQRLAGAHVARSLRRRSLSSFNFYVMHQCQILGYPPQLLLDSAVVASSAGGRTARSPTRAPLHAGWTGRSARIPS